MVRCMEVANDFKPIKGYECLNACICNYLSLWGYPLDTSVVFFCGHGFKIKYLNNSDEWKISATVFKSDFEFMKRYNIGFCHSYGTDAAVIDEMKNKLIKMVEEGRYISIKVSSNHLKYNRVFSQNDSLHYINVVGYDQAENKLLVIDGFVPTMVPSTFFGWVDLNDILEGWSKIQFDYIEFAKPDGLDYVKIKSDFKSDIIEQLNSYISENKTCDKAVYGYQALLALFHEIEHCSSDQVATVTRDINYQIRVHGMIGSRYFLMNAVGLLLENSKITAALAKCLSRWNSVCMMLIKASFLRKPEYIHMITEEVEKIVNDENGIINEIIHELINE